MCFLRLQLTPIQRSGIGCNRGEYITKGNTMKKTYAIGDIYTTTKTQETGTIKEIVIVNSNLVKIRLDVSGTTRWTTWKPE